MKKINQKQKKKQSYIFQIGFNRCATQSLTNAFQKLHLKTIHHNFKFSSQCHRSYLALVMYNNLRTGDHKILRNELSKYQCFLDMEYIYQNYHLCFYTYFKEIEQQYPGSSFIMNIRPCSSWIISRIKLGKLKNANEYYKNITEDKCKEWVQHYFEHSLQVRDYFQKPHVKKRSKLYILPIGYKTISQLFVEMNLTHQNIQNEKINFIQNIKLSNEEKQLPSSVLELIQQLTTQYGDPSNPIFWKSI